MKQCHISWHTGDLKKWDDLFTQCPRSTLLQHYPYAQAVRVTHQQSARHGMIVADGQTIGLFQLQEVSILEGMWHAICLDRGPLWLPDHGNIHDVAAFLQAFTGLFPKRIGRKRRFIPEIEDTEYNRTLLNDAGFIRKDQYPSYETLWLDVTPPVSVLRAQLKGSWRNALSKAEKCGMRYEHDKEGRSLTHFLQQYQQDRMVRQYQGPSVPLLKALWHFMHSRHETLLLNAYAPRGTECIAAILVLLHGQCATYQTGWTSPQGRALAAHHFLLWQAITTLKDRGITGFDLGGVQREQAEGVSQFKEGLGGNPLKLCGFYA